MSHSTPHTTDNCDDTLRYPWLKYVGFYSPTSALASGESSYTPPALPLWPLDTSTLKGLIDDVEGALQEICSVSEELDSVGGFDWRMWQEAIASCHIAGIHASLEELIIASEGAWFGDPDVLAPRLVAGVVDANKDADQVVLYVMAPGHVNQEEILFGLDGLPMSFSGSVKAMHELLMQNEPEKTPGYFRQKQCWIGSSSHVAYVPPCARIVDRLMENLGEFIHSSEHHPFVTSAVAHAQFALIHPFMDGNGRVGRMLIHWVLRKLQHHPSISKEIKDPRRNADADSWMYPSKFELFVNVNAARSLPELHFSENQQEYYTRLQRLNIHGGYLEFVQFFLEGIREQAKKMKGHLKKVLEQFRADRELVGDMEEDIKVLTQFVHCPIMTREFFEGKSPPYSFEFSKHSRACPTRNIRPLKEKGIIEEKDGVLRYRAMIEIMEMETEKIWEREKFESYPDVAP